MLSCICECKSLWLYLPIVFGLFGIYLIIVAICYPKIAITTFIHVHAIQFESTRMPRKCYSIIIVKYIALLY